MRRARLVWSDNAVTDATEGGFVDAGRCHMHLNDRRLRVHNGGYPDPTPASMPRPQPAFIKELTLWMLPDECVPSGAWSGARYQGDEQIAGEWLSRWLIITPTDPQQPNAYPIGGMAEYAQIVQWDCLEGGKKIIVPIAKRTDSLRVAENPTLGDAARLLDGVLRLDDALYQRHRAVYDHFFQCLFKFNAASYDVTVHHGYRNAGAMLNPYLFAERTGITTDSYADYANVWQIGTREPGVSNRVEFYWYIRAWLIAAAKSSDSVCLSIARFLGIYKEAHGFLEIDQPHRKNNRWCGEHSIGGVLGDADCKQFSDHDLLAMLWPMDADAVAVAGKARAGILAQPYCSGGGGARNCGNYLENLWYAWKASGDDALKVRAHQEIAHLFTSTVRGNLFFQENIGKASVSGGEGVLLLRSCFRWVVDGGGDQTILPKLDAMLANYLAKGGRWVGTDQWQACYFWDDADPAVRDWGGGRTGTQGGGSLEQGIFWVGLRRFAKPSQIVQFDALEKLTFARFATVKGADDDGWYPGGTKWWSIFANSLCG